MAEIVEVVEAGQGWTKVRDSEGNVFKLEGSRNWRNNNPGNIEYGDFAKSLGAVGSDGRFAVFPSYDAGRQAKEQLIFSSPKYQNLTLAQAISRYAPPNENNTQAYLNQVVRGSGVPASTPMSQIPNSARKGILDTMERVEGFKVGRTYNEQGIPLPPSEIPNVVASALSTVPTPQPGNPVTMSPDLAQLRNPAMSLAARNAQVTPTGNVALPRPRPDRPSANTRSGQDLGLLSPNAVTPRLTPQGDNAYTYWIPDVTPTDLVGGAGSLTPSIGQQPYPAQMSPQIAGLRARDQELQYELSRRYPTNPLPPLAPSGNAAALEEATRRAALLANQSGVERNPMRPGLPQSYAGMDRAPPLREARLQTPGIPQVTNVALRQPPIQVVASPQQARRVAPIPMPAAMRPLQTATRAFPQVSSVQPRAPLRVVVNGSNPIAQALQAPQPSMSKAAIYNALTAAARGPASVEERVSGSASSYGGGASSIYG